MQVNILSSLNLAGCNPPCKIEDLASELVERLVYAQHIAGFAFDFSCGYRSQSYELSKGRKGTSSHSRIPCLAVDIVTLDSHVRFKVVTALLMAGFPRLGIGKNFVHADIDETKSHPIIFHYYDGQNT